jgi:DNA-binding GntR family transcriptional regulator
MTDPAVRLVQGDAQGNQYIYTSKADMVTALLRQMILSGELPGSQVLHQRDIAGQFGVSQTPVREALRRLESEGLVVGDTHRGVVVAEARGGSVEENAQIRAALESLSARLAAASITKEQLASLEQLNQQMVDAADDMSVYAALNRQFHFAIYESANSPLLLSLMRLLWRSMPNGPLVRRDRRESARQHDEILIALRNHDGEAAARTTHHHIVGADYIHPASPRRGAPTRRQGKA